MNILLTGASSFTGKALVPGLEKAGHEIFRLVRQDKGFSNQLLWDFKSDLPSDIPECKAVIHLAADVDFNNNLNVSQYEANTISTAKLAAYACRNDAYIVFSSTVGVHGSKPIILNRATPVNPENNYSMSKYLAEEILRAFARNYTVLRIGGIYGLDGPRHLGLNTAISNAYYRKESPTIRGPGKAKRNYICINDVAQWIIYLLDRYGKKRNDTDRRPPETLYLAGTEIMTIEEYLKDVAEVLLSGGDVNRVDGLESKDMVIEYTPFPFIGTTFWQYLQSLCQRIREETPGRQND